MISPEISQVRAAAVRAITTIHVAQRSARPTILAFPASADCTRRIILWIELSSPTLDAFISKAPNWFTVPDETSSPTVLSTGSDSPVMTAWFTEVCPDVITPSTGTVSPGSTRRISPTFTCSAGMVFSPCFCEHSGCLWCQMYQLLNACPALATVSFSRSPPSCMMKATSPAAKSSLMSTDAIRASETSTSALISNSVTSPMTASRMIGIPHRMIATHAGSNGRSSFVKNADQKCDCGNHQEQNVSFGSTKFQKFFQFICYLRHSFPLLLYL